MSSFDVFASCGKSQYEAILYPQNAPFSGQNANLTNGTCFMRPPPFSLSETGRTRVLESTVSNTKLSEFFLPSPSSGERTQRVPLSLFCFVCLSELTEWFPRNSPSLPQKSVSSVSSLPRNSTLETVFRPFATLAPLLRLRPYPKSLNFSLSPQRTQVHGWPFTLRGGCRAELRKLPQWFSPLRWLATFFFEKWNAEIGHLPGGLKCEFGGGSRVLKKSISIGNSFCESWTQKTVLISILCSDSQGKKTFADKKTAVKNASGSGRRKWPAKPRCEATTLVAPVYCSIPRDYLSDTPLLCAMGFLVSQHGQLGAIPPPPFWALPPWRACEVEVQYSPPPPPKGVSQRYWRDTLWKQGKWVRDPPLWYYRNNPQRVLRDMGGISHWAAEATTLGVFDLCQFDPLKRGGGSNPGVFRAPWSPWWVSYPVGGVSKGIPTKGTGKLHTGAIPPLERFQQICPEPPPPYTREMGTICPFGVFFSLVL